MASEGTGSTIRPEGISEYARIPDKNYFRVSEVAKLTNESVRTIYYWIKIGRIQAIRRGRRKLVIPREEVERLMNAPRL